MNDEPIEDPIVTVEGNRLVVDFEANTHSFTMVQALVFVNDILSNLVTLRVFLDLQEEDDDQD